MKITSIKQMIHPGVVIGDNTGKWAYEVLAINNRNIWLRVLYHNSPNVKIGMDHMYEYAGVDGALRNYDIIKQKEILLEDLI